MLRLKERAKRWAFTPPILALKARLERAWGADTAVDVAGWSASCPSWGQCAVTALIVQDIFGGSLMRAEVDGISHYWNKLPTGEQIDLTRDQFATFRIDGPPEERSREYVLSNLDTLCRYELLKSRLVSH
jgi:hypothetical protein